MPAADNLAAFAVTAFIIIVIPGPSVLFIVARALAHGRKVSVLTVAGNTTGEYVQVAAVAFGIGLLAERSVAIFTVLKLFGAAYLVYLGVKTIRDRRSLAAALAPAPEALPAHRYFLQGFIVGVSNPKTVIFLVAILPQFVTRSGGQIPAQILLLGLVFSLVGGVGGLTIIAVGLGLAASGRKD